MNIFEVLSAASELLESGEIKESDEHEECDIAIFRLVRDGQHWGATKKRESRATICLPRVVCGESIAEYEDWVFYTFAIKKPVWEKITASEKKASEVQA